MLSTTNPTRAIQHYPSLETKEEKKNLIFDAINTIYLHFGVKWFSTLAAATSKQPRKGEGRKEMLNPLGIN